MLPATVLENLCIHIISMVEAFFLFRKLGDTPTSSNEEKSNKIALLAMLGEIRTLIEDKDSGDAQSTKKGNQNVR